MDLCCFPRSLPILVPTRAHFRPISPLFRPIPTPSTIKSLTSLPKSGFRATATEETSTFVSEPEKNETEEEKEDDAPFNSVPVEKSAEKSEVEDFISKVNLKLDYDDTYSIFIYGTGALVALWLSSAVVGALDSIPLIPKVFEVVGLAYTVWFSYRYLIFKKNREELYAMIDDLKGKIIGADDE